MDDKASYEKLAKFASAMARGATVKMNRKCRSTGDTCRIGLDGASVDANYFGGDLDMIQIIEPTVLRDWTAEDAKKHLGWGIRHVCDRETVFVIRDPFHTGGGNDFCRSEYAAPIPGADPATWDWKPCKVEVPVEAPKADSVAVASIRNALTAMAMCQDWRNLNRPIIMGWINDALLSLESP